MEGEEGGERWGEESREGRERGEGEEKRMGVGVPVLRVKEGGVEEFVRELGGGKGRERGCNCSYCLSFSFSSWAFSSSCSCFSSFSPFSSSLYTFFLPGEKFSSPLVPTSFSLPPPQPTTPLYIFFTSGTTSEPKGCFLYLSAALTTNKHLHSHSDSLTPPPTITRGCSFPSFCACSDERH